MRPGFVEAGADPKALQAQMRHSRISTTMGVFSQFVPAAQRRAVAQMIYKRPLSQSRSITLRFN